MLLTALQRCFMAVFILAFALTPSSLLAMTPGWYLGAGYGQSSLDPTVPFDIFETSETEGEQIRGYIGYDFDEAASMELAVTELGEAVLSNEDTVLYRAADIAGLYRFYDYRRAHGGRGVDLNVFARLGLGYLDLQSDTAIEPASRIHMLAGAGIELRLLGPLGLRADLEFYDADALAASVSMFMRFSRQRTVAPAPAANLPRATQTAPRPASPPAPRPLAPVTPVAPPAAVVRDSDGDGIKDSDDRCADSRIGYPVREDGCALLNGTLSGLRYSATRTGLTPEEQAVLRGLANLLKKHPAATVQLVAHSSATTSDSVNLAVTRERLKKIGRFLLKAGVPATQTKYLAYGSRANQNARNPERIEIREFPGK